MLGAIAGDIIGSVYEFNNHKSKTFPLWRDDCNFTDDTVMTIAVGNVCRSLLTRGIPITESRYWQQEFTREMHRLGNAYPGRGYGARFLRWLESNHPQPYNSFGNGSAMRVSPVTFCADKLDECLQLAALSACPTHNHPEGIHGAKAAAAAGWLAGKRFSKITIRSYIEQNFYPLDFTLDDIRENYRFNEICRDTVPQAIVAFLEADSFEDTIRNAISIGGDSDTIAAIAGGIAEAYYGVPLPLRKTAQSYLTPDLQESVRSFYSFIEKTV